jgi:hypothetical protein
METTDVGHSSLLDLARDFKRETKNFLRQEVRLARTEFSEKLKTMTSGAASVAIGGLVAYAGAIVFLIGFGELLAFAFARAGLDSVLSQFIGLGIIGLVIAGVGVAMLMTALKKLSAESLAPKRTLHTLQEFRGDGVHIRRMAPETEKLKLSSAELEKQVERTEARIGYTLDEMIDRVSPRRVTARVKARLQEKPYHAGLIAMVVGIVGGLLVRRRFLHP